MTHSPAAVNNHLTLCPYPALSGKKLHATTTPYVIVGLDPTTHGATQGQRAKATPPRNA